MHQRLGKDMPGKSQSQDNFKKVLRLAYAWHMSGIRHPASFTIHVPDICQTNVTGCKKSGICLAYAMNRTFLGNPDAFWSEMEVYGINIFQNLLTVVISFSQFREDSGAWWVMGGGWWVVGGGGGCEVGGAESVFQLNL
jgi:hypothetical protein